MFSRLFSHDNKTRLPRGTRIYAVGDIHGRADLLEQITCRIDEHLASNPIDHPIEVYLGDYIDRGPSSRQVIDQLIHRGLSHQSVFLKGNHEGFLIESLKNPRMLDNWEKNGGLQTLASYGIAPPTTSTAKEAIGAALKTAMPTSHHVFFSRLKSSFVCGGYFFVHAGARPGIALNRQSESDLLWIREEFLASAQDFGKIIVHGHTPVQQPDVRSNRINIDTGAFATGRLTCAALEHDEITFI
jgi:serine/threonine protein phosphatase 1